jgi:hypothetical protein
MNGDLLKRYVETFYGYGNYGGDWWLVGMEEGGGDNADEVERRLRLWDERGRRELEDVAAFAFSDSHAKWFTGRPPLQPTWRKLIRLVLSAGGRSTDAGSIRSYQRDRLARPDGETCLLELMPLPSPSTAHWIYGEYSDRPELASRECYNRCVAPARILHLRQRIAEHGPKVVVFYGRSYRESWEHVTGGAFCPTDLPGLDIIVRPPTVFAMIQHPATVGVTNTYFEETGDRIATLFHGCAGHSRVR